jgi:hypothetical protein
VVSSFGQRKWKALTIKFSSPGFVEQYSKKEDRWNKLETKCKQQTTKVARKIQSSLELTEEEIRIDGDIHEEIDANSDIKYTGVATISFLKVR